QLVYKPGAHAAGYRRRHIAEEVVVEIERHHVLRLIVESEIAMAHARAGTHAVRGHSLGRIDNQRVIGRELPLVRKFVFKEYIWTIELPLNGSERRSCRAGIMKPVVIAAFEVRENPRDPLVWPVVPGTQIRS